MACGHKGLGRSPRWLVVLVWVLGACQSDLPPLDLSSVSPTQVFSDRRTAILISGRFYSPVEVELLSGEHTLRDDFVVAAGELEMVSAELISEEALSAVVPPWFPVGTHDLRVTDPLDREAVLPASLQVLPPDRDAPEVEIISPENGDHVLRGQTFTVYYRASDIEPGKVIEVRWTVAGATSESGHDQPEDPDAVLSGTFPVRVPPHTDARRVVVQVVASDDAPAPNEGSARIEVLVDHCIDDRDCDNGSFCDGPESCVDGVCTSGEAPSCDDGFSCTLDLCDEAYRGCLHVPQDGACDDGLFCNGREVCREGEGCVSGHPPCDDGLDCTVDYCEEPTDEGADGECWAAPDHERCQDGIFCNGAEICDIDLGCRPGPPPCADSIECTVEICREASRDCRIELDHEQCDDGDECTEDLCVESEGCVHRPGVEGPPGDPSCRDHVDNDCDDLTDRDDPDCRE